MNCFCLVLIFLFVHAFQIGKANPDTGDTARKAYGSGRYTEALQAWRAIEHEGITDADLFYNIGNAESVLGNIPEAIMAYEKALRIKPVDWDIAEALEHERNRIENAVIPVRPFFLSVWFSYFAGFVRPGVWALAGLIIACLGVFKWLKETGVIQMKSKDLPGRFWLYISAGGLLLLLSFLSYQRMYRLNEAIVFSNCSLRQGPSVQSPHVRELNAGEKLKITDQLSGWNKVRLLNLDEGWIQDTCVKRIDLRKKMSD